MTSGVEAEMPVEAEGESPFGRYDVRDTVRWSLLAPQPGNILITEVPGEVFGQEGVEAIFVVIDRILQPDGSLLVPVRVIGASRDDALPALSSLFNRRAGELHICLGEGPCLHEGAAFHVRQLELWDGATFPGSRLSSGGRRLLKQVLTGKDDEPSDQWETREGFALKPRPGKDPKGAKATAKRKVTGDGKGGRPPAGPKRKKKDVEEVDDADPTAPSALRGRLEKIRARQEALKPGAHRDNDGDDWGREEAGDAPHAVAPLTTGRKLIETKAFAGRGRAAPPLAVEGQKDGIMKSLKDAQRTAGVTSSLVLRAAEAYKKGRAGRPKKKKEKREKAFNALRIIFGGKKAKKKKKKKKDSDQESGDGDSGGSGDPSGSDGSGSSSDEKDSSEEASLLPPLKKRSDRQEGSVLELLVEQVEARLNELSGAGGNVNPLMQGTKIVTYWHSLTQGGGVNQQTRDGREMFLIANCVDLLRVGRLGRLGDALAARWFALEQAQLDQNWSAAKHLELYSPEHLTAAGPAITLAARKYSKLMDKVAAADDHKPRPWAKGRLGKSAGGWSQAGPWQEKGGKGKGGKHQNDDKWDKWNKEGQGAWKKQPWQNSWKKPQQQDSKAKADATKEKEATA